MVHFLTASVLLLATCGLTDCELQGGMGYQPYAPTTHDYGQQLGELRLTSDWGDSFYASCTHISGINTPEPDWGLNYCAVGFSVRF